jgi:SSS family solute:Na+ symporter
LAAGAATIPYTIAVDWIAKNRLPEHIAVYVTPFNNRTGIVFWLCILTCVVVSLLTKPKSEEELKGLIWNKESLRLPLDQRAENRGLRSPFLWWAIITAVVLAFYICYP